MKNTLLVIALIAGMFFVYSCGEKGGNSTKEVALSSQLDSLSYAFGVNIAENLEKSKVENLNVDALANAFNDYYAKKTKFDGKAATKYINDFFKAKEKAKYKEQIAAGEKFLADKAKEKGVVKTESGLLYKVIKPGTGKQPQKTDQVTVNYKGTLIDGTTFDSSYDRKKPTTFGVTRVIKGWTEALLLMKEGAKWEIYVPYNLAYGERGAGAKIKPYSTLIFEVELIKTEEAPKISPKKTIKPTKTK